MRIVNRSEFLKLPAGTVFSKFEPCVFGDLLIKGDSLTDDFFYQSINDATDHADSNQFADDLIRATETGEELAMDFHCQGRDGLFDSDQLFAVWNTSDVMSLVHRLIDAMSDAYDLTLAGQVKR